MSAPGPYRAAAEWSRTSDEQLAVRRVGPVGHHMREVDSLLVLTREWSMMGMAVMVDATTSAEVDAVRDAFTPMRDSSPFRSIDDADEQLHRFVCSARHRLRERSGQGASITAIAWFATSAVVHHIGEARAYALSSEPTRRLTIDDTFLAPAPVSTWILARSLGLGDDAPTVSRVSLEGVSALLFCSSRVHRHADDTNLDLLTYDFGRWSTALDEFQFARRNDASPGTIGVLRLR